MSTVKSFVKPTMPDAPLNTTPAMTTQMGMNMPVQTVSQAPIGTYEAIEAAEKAANGEVTLAPITEAEDFDTSEALRELAMQEAKEQTKGSVASAPTVAQMSPQALDDFLADSIIAVPLQMPNFLDLRAKDPNYRLRWVNCKAQGGVRFDQAQAMGFRVARKEEVMGLNSNIMIAPDGIKYHDVILMIIETKKILGHYKYNFLRSASRVQRSGQEAMQRAKQDVQAGLRHEGISQSAFQTPGEAPKLDFYIPGDKELNFNR